MKVIISAGGTGGHIYPALAIVKKIKEKEPNSDILYIGTHNRMEKDIVPKENMEQEVEEAGFRVLATHAVEGCIWFTPNLNENWESPEIREKLLEILHLTEKDRELMGMSPHFLTMAVKG